MNALFRVFAKFVTDPKMYVQVTVLAVLPNIQGVRKGRDKSCTAC